MRNLLDSTLNSVNQRAREREEEDARMAADAGMRDMTKREAEMRAAAARYIRCPIIKLQCLMQALIILALAIKCCTSC